MLTGNTVALALLIIICLYDDVRVFTRPRENWRTAAATMKQLSTDGTCLLFSPPSSIRLYLVFEKTLESHQCNNKDLPRHSRIALAISPYGGMPTKMPPYFIEVRRTTATEPVIEVYRRSKAETNTQFHGSGAAALIERGQAGGWTP
jgi:hypothetical protein